MTFDLQSKSTQDSLNARATLALRVVVAVSLAAACVMALAESSANEEVEAAMSPAADFSEVDLGRLERIFWVCDHAATIYGVDGPNGIACGTATEQLKQRMFGGDFEAMLAWWQAHKDAEHQVLSQSQKQADEQSAEATVDASDFPMP